MTHFAIHSVFASLTLFITCGILPTSAQNPAPDNASSAAAIRDQTIANFTQWGKEALAQVKEDFWMNPRGYYAEDLILEPPQTKEQKNSRQASFMWGCGVQLSALTEAALADRSYIPHMRAYADALQDYWVVANNIGGYNVLPHAGPDRYYDDNAWIALDMVEVYEVTKNPKYLRRAEETIRFVISCEDDKVGGGLYWREDKKNSKNTCTNAPAITGLLRIYQYTGKEEYLKTALRLYEWTRSHLQDADGLFWDSVDLENKPDKVKLTYNSALMLRANCLLYQITGEEKYLAEARRVATAAKKQWFTPEGGVKDVARFSHLLTGAFLRLNLIDKDTQWLETVDQSVNYLRTHLHDTKGRYSERWENDAPTPTDKITLLDQASAARAFWETANAYRRTR